MASLELMSEEVQVWVASLDVNDARYEALSRTLPPDERERAGSLSPIAGRRFVVARAILRKLLSGFTGTAVNSSSTLPSGPAAKWQCVNNLYGWIRRPVCRPVLGGSQRRPEERAASWCR